VRETARTGGGESAEPLLRQLPPGLLYPSLRLSPPLPPAPPPRSPSPWPRETPLGTSATPGLSLRSQPCGRRAGRVRTPRGGLSWSTVSFGGDQASGAVLGSGGAFLATGSWKYCRLSAVSASRSPIQLCSRPSGCSRQAPGASRCTLASVRRAHSLPPRLEPVRPTPWPARWAWRFRPACRPAVVRLSALGTRSRYRPLCPERRPTGGPVPPRPSTRPSCWLFSHV
jgi:hypothetical protein